MQPVFVGEVVDRGRHPGRGRAAAATGTPGTRGGTRPGAAAVARAGVAAAGTRRAATGSAGGARAARRRGTAATAQRTNRGAAAVIDVLAQGRPLRAVGAVDRLHRQEVVAPARARRPVGRGDAVLLEVGQHPVHQRQPAGIVIRHAEFADHALLVVFLQPFDEGAHALHAVVLAEFAHVDAGVVAAGALVEIGMRLEDQVVGRILECQQGVVPQRPAGGFRPAVAFDHDRLGLVDGAYPVDAVLGGDRPLSHGVVRLVHDVVGIERRLAAPALGDTGHDLLIAIIGHRGAADDRTPVEGVVVQVEDDAHAVLLRIGEGLVDQRRIGRIQGAAQDRLQPFPDDRETDQLDALATPLLEVGLDGKDVVGTVHAR